jgi:hypothetical protein
MNYTNAHNLPAPFFQALTKQTYFQDGDISVTGLIRPPLMRRLERDHDHEIVVDATENVWSVLGSCVHGIIERHGQENRLVEERLAMDVFGWRVTGKADLLDEDMTLTDYKVTSVYAFLLGDKPEWEAQLNLYAWLYAMHGFEVQKLQIVAILRDWMRSQATYDSSYPQSQTYVQPIKMWTVNEAHRYAERRVSLHQEADRLSINDIPVCTPQERWERPTTWAVMKGAAKKAYRVKDTESEALETAAQLGGAYHVVERPGKCVRCEAFCHGAPWCPWWQARQAEAAETDEASEPVEVAANG